TVGAGTVADATIEIDAPDGSAVWDGSTDTTGAWSDAVPLPASGTYTVTVDPVDAAAGHLTLQLNSVPADVTGTLTIGGPAATVTFTTPGQNADLTFTGTAGQKIALTTGAYSGPDGAEVTITDPNGNDVYQNRAYSSGDWSDARTLPTSGTYHVLY